MEYVGGPEYGHVLLSPLENLAAIEEPVVRDRVGYPGILRHLNRLLTCPGCGILEQDLRAALAVASRGVLRPAHHPACKGGTLIDNPLGSWTNGPSTGLVYFEDLWMRPLHSSVQEGFAAHPRTAPSTVWVASSR